MFLKTSSVRDFEFEIRDAARLRINADFAGVLRAGGLDTFDALMDYEGGTTAKNLLRERQTTRLVLKDGTADRAFYLKRHLPSPWKEYVKPLLRLTRPILGARNEFDALIRFHRLGIQTMVPVALGESGRRSFLVTEAINGCVKVSDWLSQEYDPANLADRQIWNGLIDAIAQLARTMHEAGMHHQDFYLGHLLFVPGAEPVKLYVIDLGRALSRRRLSRRWLVKDLAQLNYSASKATARDRIRFLHAYLGETRRLDSGSKLLARQINRKSRAIGEHSRKHRL